MAVTKRDNHYYAGLLKRRAPDIHEQWSAGHFASLADALRAAGLKKQRSPLHELKNGWQKASEAERREFIEWAYREKLSIAATGLPEHLALPGPIADKRYLAEWAIERIQQIQQRRALTHSDLMDELGHRRKDVSIRYAIHSGHQLQPKLIAALTKWLADNSGV